MNFDERIIELENEEFLDNIIISKSNNPILLTSVHSMNQTNPDGTYKFKEDYTRAITRMVAEDNNCSCIFKTYDDNIDSNNTDYDEFKSKMVDFIVTNNVQLVIDIHGAKLDDSIDIELGTLNNLSADYSTINELKEAFLENGINNVAVNNKFKGGKITQYIFFSTNIDIIQIEINSNLRRFSNTDNLKKVITCLNKFIKQYLNTINREEII